MKKIILCTLPLLLLTGCLGGKEKKVKAFAEKVAVYLNADMVDSLEAVYPGAIFNTLEPVRTDSIRVEKTGDETFIVNYSSSQWIEVKGDGKGKFEIVKSKGLAAFPEEKYEIALKTGMIDESTDDVIAQERMNDNGFFEWVSVNTKQPIELTPGKVSHTSGVDLYGRPCEGAVDRMTCTVTNNTSQPISGSDYDITYNYSFYRCSDGTVPDGHATGKVKGIDLAPGATGKINIAAMDYGLRNVGIKYNVPMEKLFKGYSPFTGNEYQEYKAGNAGSSNVTSQQPVQEEGYDWLSQRPVSANDLRGKTKEELRIMRNWIYARHGYIFSSSDLTDYFSKFPWYNPVSKNVVGQLNKTELDNVEFIRSYE